MAGDYDVPCTECDGLGRAKVPNVAALSFGEKRQLVLERRRGLGGLAALLPSFDSYSPQIR
jgi:hypothetical protein